MNYNELMAQLDLDQCVAVQSLLAAAKFAVKSEEDRATVWTAISTATRVETLMSDAGRATLEAARTRWLNARRGVCGSGRSVAPDRLPDDYRKVAGLGGVDALGLAVAPDRLPDDYRKVYDPATGKSSYKYTPRPAGQDDADQAAKWAYIAQLRWEDDADARGAAEASIKLALDAREAVLRAAARVE